MARTVEAARRQRANRLRRRRSSIQQSQAWQKWIRCHLCDNTYCCNNYPDRRARSHRLYGIRCCPSCFYRVGPAVEKLIEAGILKVRKKKESHT